MSNSMILEVEGLQVSYQDERDMPGAKKHKLVLRNVSFSIQKGEILGLVGESGSGKSTLAKAVAGLLKPEKGRIEHGLLRPQMVFQDPYSSLNPCKRVEWLLEEPLRLKKGSNHRERLQRVSDMLRLVGLDERYAKHYPKQLSGGQRQRVAIAAALMQEPEFLIADEAVSALDVTVQAQIISLLKKLHEEMNLSMLFISHDLRVVYQICDKVMIMHEGEIVEEGKTEQVFFAPTHSYTKRLLSAAGILEEEKAI